MKYNPKQDTILTYLYTLVAFYCVSSIYYGFFFINKVNDGFTYTSLISVTFIFLLTLTCLNKVEFNLKNLTKKNTFLVSCLGILSLLLLILSRRAEYQYSIWLDEYVQFIYSNMLKEGQNISAFAATEQQPPLGYYSMTLAKLLFGFTHFSVKFTPMFFSAAFYISIPLMLYALSKNLMASLTIYIYAIMHIIFIFYSVEARSYSQAITFGSFTIFYIYRYLTNPGSKSLILLLSSQFFLVNSIGFQPEVVLIFLALSLLPVYLLVSKKLYFKYIGINVITMILFLPTMYHIYISSITSDKFSLNLIQSFKNEISNLKFEDYTRFFSDTKYISIIMFSLAIFIILKKVIAVISKKRLTIRDSLNLSLCIFYIAFPIFFTLIYKTIINWHFSPRYYILFYVITLFTFLTILIEVKEIAGKKVFNTLCIILGTLSISLYFTNPKTSFNDIYSRELRTDWRNVYKKIDQLAKRDTVVMHFTLNDIGDWRPDIFVSKEIYAKKETIGMFINNEKLHLTDSKSQLFKYINNQNRKIILLVNTNRTKREFNDFLTRPSKLFKLDRVKNIALLSFENDLSHDLEKFLHILIHQFGDKSWSYLSYEVLIDYNIQIKNYEQAAQLIKGLKRIELNKRKTIEGSYQNKERIRSEIVFYYLNKLNEVKRHEIKSDL